MNLLVENGIISEMECGSNFAYVLSDNSTFSSTEYKVLQSQTNSDFIKCMKMLHNGKIELYYLVNAYKPLSSLLPNLDPDHFIMIVGNLLARIVDVKNNGFLTCCNIDSSFEHVYVDLNTFKVGLVYIPLSKHEYGDTSSFENALRTDLVRVITGIATLTSSKTTQLSADLQNGRLSIEDIYFKLGGKGAHVQDNKQVSRNEDVNEFTSHGTIKLVALNAPTRVEIQITKPEFTIGKKESNDGVISFNKMISRFHCKITNNGRQYMISDLQSANGTFVNGIKLQPNVPAPLKSGDMVRLADSDFRVVIQ